MEAPRHLLVPVDLSDASRAGLTAAEQLAVRFNARLTVLHVATATAGIWALLDAGDVEEVQAAAKREVARLHTELDALVDDTLTVREGADTIVVEDLVPPDAILRWAEEHKPDWICMSTAGTQGWRRFFLGSTAAEIVRRSTRPVLALRAREKGAGKLLFDDFRRVLLPVDFGEKAPELVACATLLATPDGSITPLHVIDVPAPYGLYGTPLTIPAESVSAAREWSEGALRKLVADIPDAICEEPRVAVGRAAESILEVEEELHPDVTVVGTHGRHGLERLMLGSVAERVVRAASGPVLVVPTHD